MTSTVRIRPLAAALAAASVLGLAALGALVPALPASAHDQLVSASPEDGAAVSELTGIELTFSATLLSIGEDQRSSAIQVVHDGRYFETACPTLVDDTASVAVEPGEAGEYEVRWQVVSSDGHTISDEYTIDYEPADGAAVSEGSDAPLCGEASGGDDAAAQPSDDSVLIVAASAIGGIALIGVVLAVVLGRRNRQLPGESAPIGRDAARRRRDSDGSAGGAGASGGESDGRSHHDGDGSGSGSDSGSSADSGSSGGDGGGGGGGGD